MSIALVDVLARVLNSTSARVLIEKPLTNSCSDLEVILPHPGIDRVEVLCHAACAPEVECAVEHMDEWVGAYGQIECFEQAFTDPYSADAFEAATRIKHNSWIDSGINAMNVIERFLKLTEVSDFDKVSDAVSTYVAWRA